MILTVNRKNGPKSLPRKRQIVLPLQSSYVYGPIRSRRLGSSLGINLLPLGCKYCVFDCVYCQYGWTPSGNPMEKLKPAGEILREIRNAFDAHKKAASPVDCLTIAGNGEATIHPDFSEIVSGLLKLRNEFYPGVKIGILSDSATVDRPEIRAALAMLDKRYMKLDAGNARVFEEINRPRGHCNFDQIIQGLKLIPDIVIQSLFVQGGLDNTQPSDVADWIQRIKEINPCEVHVYTIDRAPADPRLKSVENRRLQEIAGLCKEQTGVSTVVFD